jgi:hypothetical protein
MKETKKAAATAERPQGGQPVTPRKKRIATTKKAGGVTARSTRISAATRRRLLKQLEDEANSGDVDVNDPDVFPTLSDEQVESLKIPQTPQMKRDLEDFERRLKATEPEEIRQLLAWALEIQDGNDEPLEDGKSVFDGHPFVDPEGEDTATRPARSASTRRGASGAASARRRPAPGLGRRRR